MINRREAFVFIQDEFCGTLSETDKGYSFFYDENYIKKDRPTAISLTMPISDTPYTSNTLFPFFDGLIPEGWLLQVVCDNWKISEKDRFGLLLVACRDCIGNVSIRRTKE